MWGECPAEIWNSTHAGTRKEKTATNRPIEILRIGVSGKNRSIAIFFYHPEIAHEYGLLKKELADQFPDDIEAYMDGKDPFIKEHLQRAQQWFNEKSPEGA